MKTIYIVINLMEQPVVAFYTEKDAQKYIDTEIDFSSSCKIMELVLTSYTAKQP